MKKGWITAILLLLSACLITACTPAQMEEPQGEPYAFTVDGVSFTPGGSAASVFAVWRGQAPKISTVGSCFQGVDGEDVAYVYTSFHILTFRESAADTEGVIVSISLTDDSVATAKGIAIGASAQAVKDAYGTPTAETDSLYIYERGGTQLRFGLREGTVTNISYTLAE